jgi:hypothetical protein
MRKLVFVLALLLLPNVAGATITHTAHDASAVSSSTSSLSITVTSSTAGSLMTVSASWLTTTATITVSGNISGSFTSGVGPINNGTAIRGQQWYFQNSAGGDTTITLTVTGGPVSISAHYSEYTGAATSGGTDGTSSGTGSGLTADAGALSTTGSNDIVVASGNWTVGGTFTAGSGYTLNTSTRSKEAQEWQIFTSVLTNHHATVTTNTTGTWVALAMAFQAAGGAPCPKTLRLMGAGC